VFEVGSVLAGGVDADVEVGVGMLLVELLEALLELQVALVVFEDGEGLGSGKAVGAEEGDAVAVASSIDADTDAVEGGGGNRGHRGTLRTGTTKCSPGVEGVGS
jgi:hypothetical protein